jgi:hypothetical protein
MEEIKGFLNKDALSKYVPKIPSELGLSYKWELTLEKLALHSTIGFVSCGLASLVLFRKYLRHFHINIHVLSLFVLCFMCNHFSLILTFIWEYFTFINLLLPTIYLTFFTLLFVFTSFFLGYIFVLYPLLNNFIYFPLILISFM